MNSYKIECVLHSRINEIFCETCNVFLCPECVTEHSMISASHVFSHINKYVESKTIEKLDIIIEKYQSMKFSINDEAKNLLECSDKINQDLNKTIEKYNEMITKISKLSCHFQGLIMNYKYYIENKKVKANVEILQKQKYQLADAISKNDQTTVIRIAKSIQNQIDFIETEKAQNSHEIVRKIDSSITAFENIKYQDNLIKDLQAISCRIDIIKNPDKSLNWKLDRKYLTEYMSLSTDCLTYGLLLDDHYSTIIGDIIFEKGIYCFEVIPNSLNKAIGEGFGIIDLQVYQNISSKMNITEAYLQMIGYFYKKNFSQMCVTRIADMKMGEPYYVTVNMDTLKITIEGPGVLLYTFLNSGKQYVPCFSLSSIKSSLTIKPIDPKEREITKEYFSLMKP